MAATASAGPPPLLTSLVATDVFFSPCGSCAGTARSPRDAVLNLFDPATGAAACSLCGPAHALQVRRSSYHGACE